MSTTTNPPTIFSHPFADIERAQQGGSLGGRLRPVDRVAHKAQIERDVARFRISVAAAVVEAYQLALPAGYALQGDTFVFTAPTA